jgi:hypothetical protein
MDYTIPFYAICIFHCLIWAFIIFAFLNKKTAYINLFYAIPFIYILHILPFHILETVKEQMYPDDYKDRMDSFFASTPFGLLKTYVDTQHKLDDYCFGNPIGPQGMLIFGAISSAYALRRGKIISKT